jgi:hypothetical protein
MRVLPEGATVGGNRGQDWGEWNFTSLPRRGDHIDLRRNDCTELLTVRGVIHFSTEHPLPRSEAPYLQRKEPSICIIAVRAALARAEEPVSWLATSPR